MKKAFKHLLAATVAAFMLVGCNNTPVTPEPEPEHTHTFAEAWSKDATHHWHAATCGHDVKDGYAAHTFGEWRITKPATETEKGSKEHTCSVCEYVGVEEIPMIEHVHTFSTDWSYDENTHWHAATCGHDVKGQEEAHTFTENWAVKTPATATEDGVEEKHCTVCGYEKTRPIWHHEFVVNYGLATNDFFTVTTVEDGQLIQAASMDDSSKGYDGFYVDMSSRKVENAEAYTFVFRNNDDARAELRIGYRDTSVQPRTFANSPTLEDYKIESLNGRSNTKLREVKDGYIKFNIETLDTAKITVPMINENFNQFVLMLVHSTMDTDITLIQTGVIVGQHNWEEGWHHDAENHWKVCLDEGCDHISQKAPHTWIADPTKTDVPATETESGTAYKVCSVCGETKEVTIPPTGGQESQERFREENVDNLIGVTAEDINGTAHGDGVKLISGGAVAAYTRVFSLVLDKTYSLANSKAAGAKFSFYVCYDGLTHTDNETNLKKGVLTQLCYTATDSAHRASGEGRADGAGCSGTILENNWMKIEISFEAYSAGSVDTFDRINFKMGEAGRVEFTEANQVLIMAGFESSGFVE